MPAIPLRDLARTELEESRWQRTSLPGAEFAAGGAMSPRYQCKALFS